jgi:hypothetical protein
MPASAHLLAVDTIAVTLDEDLTVRALTPRDPHLSALAAAKPDKRLEPGDEGQWQMTAFMENSGCGGPAEVTSLDSFASDTSDPGHLRLRFVDTIDMPYDQPDAIVTVTGHFDDPRATSCTWGDDAFFDEAGGTGPTTPPKPEQVILWCGTEFVATDIAVREGGER